MLIYVKALPGLDYCVREGGYLYGHRSRTLQWGCVCFGEDRADRQTHTKSTITALSAEAENYWLCVCWESLLNVWLAGSGLGSWEPLKPPLGEPPRTLHTFLKTPPLLSLFRKSLIVSSVRAGLRGIRWIMEQKSGWWSQSTVWACQTETETQNQRNSGTSVRRTCVFVAQDSPDGEGEKPQ